MSADRLGDLRERNKHLLKQLRQQKEKLKHVNDCNQNRKREREDDGEDWRLPDVMVTRTHGDRRPAKAALARSSVRFADTCETHGNETRRDEMQRIHHTTSTSLETSKHTRSAAEESHKNKQPHNKLKGKESFSANSCPVTHGKDQREVQSGVTFLSDDSEDIPVSERHHLQPLLGYDWIAGVLDTEDLLVDRSDEFFDDLRVFRCLYKDECVHSSQANRVSVERHLLPPLLEDKDGQAANIDTHQCTFSYRINNRLFPVPLHSQGHCPVCKRNKSSHPHTAAEPALIRVSIPRTTLLPSYEYKAHRRCSFDPSDSLGLPSHCLSGWSNKGQPPLPPPSSLDLRSSLQMKNPDTLLNEKLEQELSGPKRSEGQLINQVADVSRLARHNFQHFSTKK